MKSISIITVVYNGVDVLEKTIESVVQQDYSAIEYLIIDGQSNDGTKEIIEKYRSQIQKVVIEKDEGIYDAMNKGLELATGDYVLFLNAGDFLHSSTTIKKVMELSSADVYYGETYLVDKHWNVLGTRSELTTRQLPAALSWEDIKKGLVVCHQSFIVRRDIAPKYIMNNLSADIDWVIRCLQKAKSVIHTNMIISHFLVGGVSKQRHWTSLKNRFQVMATHFGWIQTVLLHLTFVHRWVMKKMS